MNPMESDHEVLTVKEICGLHCRSTRSTIYKMIPGRGKIPTFRIGIPTGDSEGTG